jgi:hypothetical protein
VPDSKLNDFLKVIVAFEAEIGTADDSRAAELTVAGPLAKATLGDELTGELVTVVQVIPVPLNWDRLQLVGSAGAVTPSKF